ncbi:MAG: protein-disulfide isomerase [Nitrosarchaeum sp.]|nr:protein-disulfide isomerase [Nitrosarchaeum sp.]
MGRKEKKERVEKRDNFAAKRSNEKRRNLLVTIAVFSVIISIVGYAVLEFVNMNSAAPGSPVNAGVLGSEHSHTAMLVKVFGDTFDFSLPAYQIKTSWIHFEAGDGTTIHKHAAGVTLEYLFDSLKLKLDDQCFIFQDGRQFCTTDDYTLKFYINGEKVNDIRNYEPMDKDRILIAYGGETPEEIQDLLLEVANQKLIEN